MLALTLAGACVQPAWAWNDKGHMVIARLAWRELSAQERARIVGFLEKHPHHGEFLAASRPANIPEDEWVFMRAATWADWVRGGPNNRRAYGRSDAHFINLGYLHPDSKVSIPPPAKLNVVAQINDSKKIASRGGNQEDRAVELTWLFHLVGDLHQPLHCTTLYHDTFPDGDRGGTRSLFLLGKSVVQMHRFWDGLLGDSTSLTEIMKSVVEVEAAAGAQADMLKAELAANRTPDAWAREAHAWGKRLAYLDGAFVPANEDARPPASAIPQAPEGYARNAGAAARLCAAKAGKRLAEVLRDVLAAN